MLYFSEVVPVIPLRRSITFVGREVRVQKSVGDA
jgi:hypothetical protein